MTKKTQLLKEFFKAGVTAGLLASLENWDITLQEAKVEYEKLVGDWYWLTEEDKLVAEAYATVLKQSVAA